LRKPTDIDAALRWHREALKGVFGDASPVTEDEPQVGWYKRRLVKGGPFVPARIWLEREIDEAGELVSDEILRCEVNSIAADPFREWVWLIKNPISETDFNYMKAVASHAAWYAPHEPQANPRKPIEWNTVSPPSFSKGEGE
jgi:hypothetical protein